MSITRRRSSVGFARETTWGTVPGISTPSPRAFMAETVMIPRRIEIISTPPSIGPSVLLLLPNPSLTEHLPDGRFRHEWWGVRPADGSLGDRTFTVEMECDTPLDGSTPVEVNVSRSVIEEMIARA